MVGIPARAQYQADHLTDHRRLARKLRGYDDRGAGPRGRGGNERDVSRRCTAPLKNRATCGLHPYGRYHRRMKDSARAVVIGGGVVGASVLYHLAKIGWQDVLLLEKSELTAGSTWHAAGGMHTFNGEANISKLQKYTIDLYREIEALSGQSCGLHPNGGLMLAATPGELDSLKLICSRARYLGMETEMISLEEAQRLNPLIDTSFFIGALWRADGGHCDPSGTTHAYVKAARQLGASVERFTRVLALEPRRDGTWDVVTDKGTVHAEHVVNCAGLWAREIGHLVGIELPVLAMEHHYLVTEDIPELAGREREIVNTTDYAGEIYMRQEQGWSPDRHLRAARCRLGAAEDARGLLHAAPAGGLRASGALLRGGIPTLPCARARRYQEGHQRSVHFCAGRQSARRAGSRPQQLLGRLRRDGGLQPGWRHRARAVALDGRGRSGPGHPLDGRGAIRCVCDAQVHLPQGPRELLAAVPPGLSQRGAAGGAPRAALAAP